VTGLMTTSKTEVVVITVYGDVLHVTMRELLDSSLDSLDTTFVSHLFSGEVGVASSTVPVTLEGLGVEGDLDTPLFADSEEEETSHGEVVTHVDTFARSNLEFPLRGHDFGVDTRDIDSGIHACSVVSLYCVSCKDLASSDTTVVWTLRTRETTLGPAVWCTIVVE